MCVQPDRETRHSYISLGQNSHWADIIATAYPKFMASKIYKRYTVNPSPKEADSGDLILSQTKDLPSCD